MIVAAEPPARLVLLGHPVAHSLSPVFQRAALAHRGLTVRYDALDVTTEALDATLDLLARQRGGGNVTIPHKEAVAARARCTPLAQRVGAVNTFWYDGAELIGHNTDVGGAMATIRHLWPSGLLGRRAAVLGAGGSAAAVLIALWDLGCTDIVVCARTLSRAVQLAERIEVPFGMTSSRQGALLGADLVINATPVGLHDDTMPVTPEALEADAAVFDLVYRPEETAWVRACRTAGHPAIDGLPMLVEQGAAAFECWFGTPAPREVMWRAVAGSRP
jgi:shikimate dehydrogenase